MEAGVEPGDFGAISEVFRKAGVWHREASLEEAGDLAGRFGVRELVRQGDFHNSPRALLLSSSRARTPGPVMLFDRDGRYVGLGDDRTNAALSPEFYGRSD